MILGKFGAGYITRTWPRFEVQTPLQQVIYTERGSCPCEWWLGPGSRVRNGWIVRGRGGSRRIESRSGIEDRTRDGLREIALILV